MDRGTESKVIEALREAAHAPRFGSVGRLGAKSCQPKSTVGGTWVAPSSSQQRPDNLPTAPSAEDPEAFDEDSHPGTLRRNRESPIRYAPVPWAPSESQTWPTKQHPMASGAHPR